MRLTMSEQGDSYVLVPASVHFEQPAVDHFTGR
jgi:hypothetical protein